jgi:hypothetical protein
MKDNEIPELAGWYSLPVAAEILGVSRQRLFQMGEEEKLGTLRRISGVGTRPAAYVVAAAEVDKLLAAKSAASSCEKCEELRAAGSAVDYCVHDAQPEPVAVG